MPRVRVILLLVLAVVVLAGCSGGPTTDANAPAATSPDASATTTTTEHANDASTTQEPTTVGTPATRTAVPTLAPTTTVDEPPDPRAVSTNFEHEPSVDVIYRRVEDVRGLTASERVNVSVHGIEIVNHATGERMHVGDPFDYPDDAAGMDETQTRVLQLYSSRPVPLTGLAAAGMAGATYVDVANESAYERIADDSFDVLLVHEFAHTLQEQHGLVDHARLTETTDGDLAAGMLPEGDATLTAYEYWKRYDAGGGNPLALRNGTTPRGLWTSGFYDKTRYYGALYLQTVPANRRNAHLAHPPDTTAEVMHPNATWDLPGPRVRAPVPDGWTVDRRNRVGELAIRYALRTNDVPYPQAAAASTGWWNDSMRTFDRPGGAGAAAWSTRWANETEAREFASTWRTMLRNLNATRAGDDGLLTVPGTEYRPTMHYVLVVDGPVVHVAAAETRADARAIANATGAWNATSAWRSTSDERVESDERAVTHSGSNVESCTYE